MRPMSDCHVRLAVPSPPGFTVNDMTYVTRWIWLLGHGGALANAQSVCDKRRRVLEEMAALESRLLACAAADHAA